MPARKPIGAIVLWVSVMLAGASYRPERQPRSSSSANTGTPVQSPDAGLEHLHAGSTPDRALPGDELFATAPEVVSQIEYTSPDVQWIAWRWPSQSTFHIVYATSGGQLRHFTGGLTLKPILKALESIRVQTSGYEDPPARYGLETPSRFLTVRTQGAAELFMLPLGNTGPNGSIYALLPTGQIVTIDGKLIAQLRAGAGG